MPGLAGKAEDRLTGAALKHLRTTFPNAVILKLADRATIGVLDVVINLNRITSWFEMKHATPDFDSSGIQDLNALRLAKESAYCRYLFFHEYDDEKCQYLVHPKDYHTWSQPPRIGRYEAAQQGFRDFTMLENVIRKVHHVPLG